MAVLDVIKKALCSTNHFNQDIISLAVGHQLKDFNYTGMFHTVNSRLKSNLSELGQASLNNTFCIYLVSAWGGSHPTSQLMIICLKILH